MLREQAAGPDGKTDGGPRRSAEGRRNGDGTPPHLDHVAAGAFEATLDGEITDANSTLARLVCFESREQLVGRSLADLLVDPSVLLRVLAPLADGRALAAEEVRLRTEQGHEVVVLLSAKLAVNAGEGDRRVVGTVIDITERKRRESDLERLAFEDPLTGLANRRALDEHARKYLALAERRGTLVGLAYLDLDHFKAINDRFGHSAGDAVLVEGARRMEAAARESDVISRVGGDEFVALLPDVDDLNAALTATRRLILELEATPVELDNTRVTIRAEAGISLYPEDGACLADLVQSADEAMYRGKESDGYTDRHDEDEIRTADVATARGRTV